jgi:hypothetical protein
MPSDTRPRFIDEMVDWLNRRLAPPGVMIDAETPLFRQGVLSPVRILDLIAWTERAIGRTITDREIRMDNFRTVSRIADVFVEENRAAT